MSEVWGVGPRLTTRLADLAIHSVLDLKRAHAKSIRAQCGVVLERTVAELNGLACLAIEEIVPPRKQMSARVRSGNPWWVWMNSPKR